MGEDPTGAVVPLARVDGDAWRRLRGRRQWLYRLTTLLLGFIVFAAVLDAAGLYPFYGVDSRNAVARGSGYELDVRYAAVTRPAVATPFDIEVRRDGGFDGPVTVAVSSDYLSIWDENGLDPSPSKETARPGMLIWEFDPPPGDALEVSFDARIEPAAQRGKRGFVTVLGPDGLPIVAVTFRTRVRP